MVSEIFLKFLYKFDKKVKNEKRKVLLFKDKCSDSLRDLLKFGHVTVQFFPVNYEKTVRSIIEIFL